MLITISVSVLCWSLLRSQCSLLGAQSQAVSLSEQRQNNKHGLEQVEQGFLDLKVDFIFRDITFTCIKLQNK